MTQPAKRSFSTNESDAMEVDSEALFTQSGASLVEIFQSCVSFGCWKSSGFNFLSL
jgi:hypothetical protein